MTVAASEPEEIVCVERYIDASPDFVFRCPTSAQLLKQWWAGRLDAEVQVEIDPRRGGQYRISYQTLGGAQLTTTGTFTVVEPGRLCFTWKWGEADASVDETQVDIRLDAQGSGTNLILKHGRFSDSATADAHRDGWAASTRALQGLAEHGTSR